MHGGGSERLFVYGSLQPGQPNAHQLAGLEGTWEKASVRGRLVEAGWGAGIGYRALILDEEGPEVAGYLFTSADLGGRWSALDAFEGPDYERVVAAVSLASGERVRAHVYVHRRR